MINKNVLGGTLFLQLVVAAALYFSHGEIGRAHV